MPPCAPVCCIVLHENEFCPSKLDNQLRCDTFGLLLGKSAQPLLLDEKDESTPSATVNKTTRSQFNTLYLLIIFSFSV